MSGRSKGLVLGVLSLALVHCSKPASSDHANGAASAAASAVTTSVDVAAAKPAHVYPRSKISCAELIPKMEEMSKSLKMPVKTTPGSWGKVPKEVQVLPPDGKLCGSIDMMDQAVITSSLAGKDLEKFYAPLFAKTGCEPFSCEDATSGDYVQTRCKCKGDGFIGTVTTDTGAESFTVAVMEAGFLKHKKK